MIDLSNDWGYILHISEERLRHNKTPRHDEHYGVNIETIGAAGELAARRSLGLPEKLGTHFDGGSDFVYGGRRVDVKATMWTRRIQFRFLQWPLWKPIKSEIILLTAIDISARKAMLLGFATHGEILTSPINSTRYHPCHEIRIQDLHKVWEIMPEKPKIVRISDKSAIEQVRNREGVCMYGLATRETCSGGLDVHHIKSKGSGGGDTLENMITLCRKHHNMFHNGNIPRKRLQQILQTYYGYGDEQ
jgi:5-methylcytosine-specific restriction endonuclease McrA